MSAAKPTTLRAAAPRALGFLRLAASLLLLAGVFYLLDLEKLRTRFQVFEPGYALLALLLFSLQFPLLAARWSFFGRRLGVPLGFRRALREYYLSTFLNQVLPFGVLGDALRGARHNAELDPAAGGEPSARVVSALLLDRASGQLALYVVVVALAPSFWSQFVDGWRALEAVTAVVLVLLVALLGAWRLVPPERRAAWRRIFREGARSLLTARSAIVHLPLSLALTALHVAAFSASARCLGLPLGVGAALRIVPLLLVVATVPAFVAGLGAREAAAAGLFMLMGASATDGATVSLLYGALGLVASLPGAFVLFKTSDRVMSRADLDPRGSAIKNL